MKLLKMAIQINSHSTPDQIRKALAKVQRGLRKDKRSGDNFDALKYCGVIKLKEDPLAIQQNIRNEWQ